MESPWIQAPGGRAAARSRTAATTSATDPGASVSKSRNRWRRMAARWKWVWLSMNAGSTVAPPRSTTRASGAAARGVRERSDRHDGPIRRSPGGRPARRRRGPRCTRAPARTRSGEAVRGVGDTARMYPMSPALSSTGGHLHTTRSVRPVTDGASRIGPFRHRPFLVYWIGGLVSNIGTWLQAVAASVFVYQLDAVGVRGRPAQLRLVPADLPVQRLRRHARRPVRPAHHHDLDEPRVAGSSRWRWAS